MRNKRFWRHTACGLVLLLAVPQMAACANTAQNAVESDSHMPQEERTGSTEEAAEQRTEPETSKTDSGASAEAESRISESRAAESRASESGTVPESGQTAQTTEASTEKKSEERPEETGAEETKPAETVEPAAEPVTEPVTEAALQEPETETTAKETTSIQPMELPATQTAEYTGAISVKSNSALGTEVYTGNGATIDVSNKSSGYLMAKYEGSTDKRVKIRISMNDVNYDYDLNTGGSYEAYPLQMGNGSYTVIVMQNVVDNQYAVLHTATVQVELANSQDPYLYPSQKVNFTSSSRAVKKSYDLCVGLTTDEEKVKAIYDYIIQNVKYDYDKAAQITSGTLTVYTSKADVTLADNKGICTDYATLMAVMLRAQNIPAQVIFGSEASASYHAWNKVYYNGGWVLYDATYGAGGAAGSSYTELKRY